MGGLGSGRKPLVVSNKRAKIVAQYANREIDLPEAAKRLGVHKSSIYGYFRAAGYAKRGYRKVTDPARDEIIDRYAERKITLREAVELLGVTRQRVHQMLLARGHNKLGPRKGATWSISEQDCHEYVNGLTTTESLAEKYGKSNHSIICCLYRQGVKRQISLSGLSGSRAGVVLSVDDAFDYSTGQTTLDILAEKYGMSKAGMWRVLQREGVRQQQGYRRDMFQLSKKDCRRLETRSATIAEISRENGVTHPTVRGAMIRQRVNLLPLYEAYIEREKDKQKRTEKHAVA